MEQTTYKTVDAKTFSKEIKQKGVYLLDVRTPEDWSKGHIAGSKNIDVMSDDFLEKAKEQLPKDETIAVYCGLGKHSAIASKLLSEAGYKVLNLDGGLAAWKAAGLAVS